MQDLHAGSCFVSASRGFGPGRIVTESHRRQKDEGVDVIRDIRHDEATVATN